MSDGKQTVPGGRTPEDEPRGSFTAARKAAEATGAGLDDLVRHRLRLDRDRPGRAARSVAVDDASMRQIAELSGGQFFTAATEDELRQVYAELGEQIGYEMRRVDASRPWLAGGALLLVVGVGAGIGPGAPAALTGAARAARPTAVRSRVGAPWLRTQCAGDRRQPRDRAGDRERRSPRRATRWR